MKKFLMLTVLALMMTTLTGCLSTVAHTSSQMIEYPYYVTGHVVSELCHPTCWRPVSLRYAAWDFPTKCIFWTGLAVDTPFEFTVDTLFLPYDFTMWCLGYERW